MADPTEKARDLTRRMLFQLQFALTLPMPEKFHSRFTEEQRTIIGEVCRRVGDVYREIAFSQFDPARVSFAFVAITMIFMDATERNIVKTDELKDIALMHRTHFEQMMVPEDAAMRKVA